MQLKQGTLLQGGKYRIKQVLGQGGFGITYLGEQTSLGRKVAIKEFFMKELCNRDEATSHVSVPSDGSREMVARFREKFVKEARNIANLEHPNIVSVIDVFEENGTAYYVMKYCDGESLSSLIKKHPEGLPEAQALKYIREVASALEYIHKRKMNHLDVKPANIMLNEEGSAILIDFGLAKQYDAATGQQTSSTPVGISEGYAPMEQYKKGGVAEFSPSTDIYALGATLYKLVSGQTPPNANDVLNDGLPALPASVSSCVSSAILAAMQPRKADRPQTISAWLDLLNNNIHAHVEEEPEVTIIGMEETKKPETPKKPETSKKQDTPKKPAAKPAPAPKSSSKMPLILAALVAVVGIVLGVVLFGGKGDEPTPIPEPVAQNETATVAEVPAAPEPAPTPDPAPVAEEKQEEVEAAGYDVTFTCNVPSATLYVDSKSVGSASDTHFLKTGTHNVKVTAEGYKDYTNKITVNSQTKPQKITLKEVPKAVATTGTANGHEWVDLGLPSGTKWATMNVGASSPSDYGSYFAWGETSPKSSYDWSNLKYCLDTTGDKFSKYVTDSKYGTVDGKKVLDLSDDAAHVNWGSGWRMPSKAQQDELCKKCKWTWSSQGGHNGYKVVGPNGNSIFLPAAGFRSEGRLGDVGTGGNYWSSSLLTDGSNYAYCLSFHSGGKSTCGYHLFLGRSVRPVRR